VGQCEGRLEEVACGMSRPFNTFEDQVLAGRDDRPHRTRQLLNKTFSMKRRYMSVI
jgi:hypothetical protein